MSRFTLILRFTRTDAVAKPDDFMRFMDESPDVIRSYRHDETNYRRWLEFQERIKRGGDLSEPPSIKFRFYLFDHAEAVRKQKRKRTD